jgi:hypothetical protein
MMNDSCNKEHLEVHNVVKSYLNLPEGKSINDTMVIIITDWINNVIIEKNGKKILWIIDYKWLLQNYLVGFIVLSWNIINDLCKRK